MRSRRFRPMRRMIAYLRAKRVLRVIVEYRCECTVEVDERPRRMDLSGLDESERAEWARFMAMIESDERQKLLNEPHFFRFTVLKDKVKYPLIDGSDHEPSAA